MKKLLLFCFLLGFVSADSWAKEPLRLDKSDEKGIGFRLGYGYQRTHYLEVGMYRYFDAAKMKGDILAYYCWGGGGEIELAENPNYTIKCYVERAVALFGGRVNLSYTQNKASQSILLTPELGFSFFGQAYCYFGYAIPVYKTGSDRFYGFRLSLGWSPHDVALYRY